MNRRTARLIFQALLIGVFSSHGLRGDPLWFMLLWLVALGVTVAELGYLTRYGTGPLWGEDP
jgi:hypothetical protein